jgi:hypothetical protein
MQGQQQAEGGAAKRGGGAPMAMALVTNLALRSFRHSSATCFTQCGWYRTRAEYVKAGFKGYQYSGMADNLQAQRYRRLLRSKAGEFVTDR